MLIKLNISHQLLYKSKCLQVIHKLRCLNNRLFQRVIKPPYLQLLVGLIFRLLVIRFDLLKVKIEAVENEFIECFQIPLLIG